MEEQFLFDVKRMKQRCELSRDEHRLNGKTRRCSVYIRAIQAIEDVEFDLKKAIEKAPKPGMRIEV